MYVAFLVGRTRCFSCREDSLLFLSGGLVAVSRCAITTVLLFYTSDMAHDPTCHMTLHVT